jgi:hypothetical protein
MKKLRKNDLLFVMAIISFSFCIKYLVIIFYAGHSDIYNALSHVEYFDKKQDVSGMPYSPFSYIFPYYSSYFLKNISIDFLTSLRIFTFFSEILLFYSLRGLIPIQDKKLCILIFFNPFLILYTGIHGQIDIWAFAFAFLSIGNKNERNNSEFYRGFYLSISCLIKPIFLPLIALYIIKNKKINYIFILSFAVFFLIPYFLTGNEYISLLNIYHLLTKFLVSGFDINFFYKFPNIIEIFLILTLIIYLFFLKGEIQKFIIFLPAVIIIKGGLNAQYIAWLIPLFIYNKRIGFLSSSFFSILYIYLIFNSFNSSGLFLNSSALSLNNTIFGNNYISSPLSTETMFFFGKILSFFSFIIILFNLLIFYRKKNVS